MAKYEPISQEAERWGKALLDAAFVVNGKHGKEVK